VVAGLVTAGTAWGQYGHGSIVGWGKQVIGVDLSSGFVAVAGGRIHSLGLKADGSIVAWGYNNYGQCDVPAPNTDFVAVAGGGYHSLGIKGYPHGDLNGDGCVDRSDLSILLADWNCTGGDCPGDCDGDGDTDHADLGVLLAHWGDGCW